MWSFLLAFIPRAIVQGIPLLYGSTGEIITEKSGNLNLGIPGVMYVGGICGVIGSFFYARAEKPLVLLAFVCVALSLCFQWQINISDLQNAFVDVVIEGLCAYDFLKPSAQPCLSAECIRRHLAFKNLLLRISHEVIRLHEFNRRTAVFPVFLIHSLPCVPKISAVLLQIRIYLLYGSAAQFMVQC